VRNKIDLDGAGLEAPDAKEPAGDLGQRRGGTDFRISASRGDGIQHLIAALIGFARDYFGSDEGGLISRARQRKLLQEAAASLQRSISAVGAGEDLAAEDLRTAAQSLGRLLGRVDVEDILDVIFRDFCVGK
jgi:tRNA modification GTPase